MKPLLWVDIETTGLYPREHVVLEVAMVATDARLEIEGEMVVVLPASPRKMAPEARAMHEANGLLEECRAQWRQPGRMNLMIECEDRLEWFAKKYAGRPLAGSNPGFDRAFLLEHFGRVARHFHYRLFDVNTLVAFFDILKPRTNRHRALADIYDDLRLTQELARRFSLLT